MRAWAQNLQGKLLPADTLNTEARRRANVQEMKSMWSLSKGKYSSPRDEETFSILFKLGGYFLNNLIKTHLFP